MTLLIEMKKIIKSAIAMVMALSVIFAFSGYAYAEETVYTGALCETVNYTYDSKTGELTLSGSGMAELKECPWNGWSYADGVYTYRKNGEIVPDETVQAYKDYNEALAAQQELLIALKAITIHDNLAEMENEDGTLLEFFTQSYDDIAEDTTVLYPLAASFSVGQSAGLEFISLEEMMMIALSDEDAYSDTELDKIEEISIYNGVDRSIYEKDAVALTSDAIRADFAEQVEEENSEFSPWTIAMWAVTGAMAAGAITSAILSVSFKAYSNWCSKMFYELSGVGVPYENFEAFASTHKIYTIIGRDEFSLRVQLSANG